MKKRNLLKINFAIFSLLMIAIAATSASAQRIILDTMSRRIREHELAEAAHLRIMASDALEEGEEFQEGPKFLEIMSAKISIVQMLEAIGKVIPRLKGRN